MGKNMVDWEMEACRLKPVPRGDEGLDRVCLQRKRYSIWRMGDNWFFIGCWDHVGRVQILLAALIRLVSYLKTL